MKKETYGDMVDLSIRQTMVRSINTTVAILLPLVAILIFGGPTLKDFAMALTIGVVSGTYSSFFVAAPLVTILKEREPQYKKRLALAAAVGGAGAEAVLAPASVSGVLPPAAKSGATKPRQAGGASNSRKGASSKGRSGGNSRKRKSR
jgi:SecD/SecF fusion protein